METALTVRSQSRRSGTRCGRCGWRACFSRLRPCPFHSGRRGGRTRRSMPSSLQASSSSERHELRMNSLPPSTWTPASRAVAANSVAAAVDSYLTHGRSQNHPHGEPGVAPTGGRSTRARHRQRSAAPAGRRHDRYAARLRRHRFGGAANQRGIRLAIVEIGDEATLGLALALLASGAVVHANAVVEEDGKQPERPCRR